MIATGTTVRIISYGELSWTGDGCLTCGATAEWKDHLPQIVGRTGLVDGTITQNGETLYAVKGIPEKYQWYKADQLKVL